MSWRGYARDAVKALAVAAVVAAGGLTAPHEPTGVDAFGFTLLLVGALALTARRRAPGAVLVVTTICVFVYFVRDYPGNYAALPMMIALFTAVRAGRRRVALVSVAVFVVGVVVNAAVTGDQPAGQVMQDRFLVAGWLAASVAMGQAFRQWEAYVRQAEERAADAERLRIARELHDSLTHTISVIKVQAGVAVHLARKRGEQVPEALLAIQEASREATRELRTTLGVLRGTEEQPGHGLDRLPELVERARSAGLAATLTVAGERRSLPSDVERAAYRIVQEALTNVARHAGAANAEVRVDYCADALTVQVEDDGKATPDAPPVPGVGLLGMRERVTALGGRLRAEPRSDGGFTVRAELPAADPA